MKLLTRIRQSIAHVFKAQPVLSGVNDRGWTLLHDWQPGTWQQDIHIKHDSVLANWAIFSCMTLISSDIGKVNLGLVERSGKIWVDAESAAFSPVIGKPNGYQTRQQFVEHWIISKLSRGNTYVLKERDGRGIVVGLYVLDPQRVRPLVAPDGSVFYQLFQDNLAGLEEDMPAVPASEIIHDRFNCLFHPLVGLSPIFACGLAAIQGLKIQTHSAKFFQNMSRPSGVLTAPGQISDSTALRLKNEWEKNYTGDSMGKVAVLGDSLKYEAMTINAVDAQMVEQLKASAEMICSTFHVPAFKIGAAPIPAGQKVEDLNQIYYADCLHALMDAIQTLLGLGLGLDTPKEGRQYAVRFELDDLLKMDTASFVASIKTMIDASAMAPNEGRTKLNLPPVAGGDSPMIQQQNYSLAAIAKRDATADPFGTAKPPPAPPAPAPAAPPALEPDQTDKAMHLLFRKSPEEVSHA